MPQEPAQRPPTIDPAAAARWAHLSPKDDASPWLHEEIGRRMAERLQWIKARPRAWADWSPLRGGLAAHALVAARYPEAARYAVEPQPALVARSSALLTPPWWRAERWQRQPVRFDTLPEEGVDLLWANMALHSAADPQALIAQWHRSVATDGFLMFSCLGPDTLRELRTLYAAQGWPPPGHEFTDMHDWGDMLVHAGFAEPVMDMERVVLTWPTPEAALAELRTLGRNLHHRRFAGLRGRGWRANLGQALTASVGAGEPIAMTFEIIYGHAFKPTPRVAMSGESAVSLRDMREMLRRGRPGI